MTEADVSYTISLHLPLLQGDLPTVGVLRHGKDHRVLKVEEIKGKGFEDNVMLEVALMAERLATMDRADDIQAHLVFSGRSFGHVEVDDILAGKWPQQSYSYVTVPMGAQRPHLIREEESLPLNHFEVPRLSLISAINYAYEHRGSVYMMLPEEQSNQLTSQLASFTERTATLPANDPDAILEYDGEGRVIALATCLWHHFHAQRVRANWAREQLP